MRPERTGPSGRIREHLGVSGVPEPKDRAATGRSTLHRSLAPHSRFQWLRYRARGTSQPERLRVRKPHAPREEAMAASPTAEQPPWLQEAASSAWLGARVREVLNRRAAVGIAVGVVCPGSPPLFHARGLADIESQTPVTEGTSSGSAPSPRRSRPSRCCSCGSRGWSTLTLPRTPTCAPSGSCRTSPDGVRPRSGTC
jgi:hypothetical protein